VPGADKHEMIGSKYRTTARGNLDSILFGFAKDSQFDSGRSRQLKGDVEKVFAVGEERWILVCDFIFV
jgi:hypothetical protein